MGSQAGGGGNFNPYSKTVVTPYEGIINENYFKIMQRETQLTANLEIFKHITKNPFNKQLEYFIGMLVKSKYDGVGRKLDELDISIALDISGSMSNGINRKPTFKELLQNPNEHNNFEYSNKDRLTIAKECLFKLIDSMNDKMNMALTTFDTQSKVIIPLSPKKEIKSISHLINNIKTEGGTDLSEALKGAADCLLESKAKFKRVIIITDGWNNNSYFMDLARAYNKKDILITVLSIDSSSNSSIYEKLSELKGCNYYFILNERDIEKYLIQQLNYICFPALYDMIIKYQSDDADLIRAIGCGQENEKSKNVESAVSENVLINTKTIFPSDIKQLNGDYYQEGGLMLLKIKPRSLDKNCKINIKLEYTEIEGNKFEKNFDIEFTTEEIKNGVESSLMKKGMAIYYYNKFFRKMKKFLNKNVEINNSGPSDNKMGGKPAKKYFDFLSRKNENYDKIKIYFESNYENDLNKCQKEYYIKNLDIIYDDVLSAYKN